MRRVINEGDTAVGLGSQGCLRIMHSEFQSSEKLQSIQSIFLSKGLHSV